MSIAENETVEEYFERRWQDIRHRVLVDRGTPQFTAEDLGIAAWFGVRVQADYEASLRSGD